MSGKKILIVEDEVIIAEDIADTLRSFGYAVVGVVSSGKRAIEKAGTLQPDLVLMDIMLPGEIDGIDAAESIRNRFRIPVVYLTAYADETTLQRAALTEPFGYLVKPFEDKELRTTIEIALRRHQAEEKIRSRLEAAEALRKKAEEERESKSRYLSMASHEFRNPLSTILMSSELLRQYGANWSESKKLKHFQRIEEAVINMNQMLEDILTIGSAESGKIFFNPVPLDVVDFCQDMVETLQHIAGSNHRISFTCQGDCTGAVMDEKLLHHILSNLISNAIKYSPQGGTVSLEVVRKQEPAVIFRIRDEGIGIPPNERDKLFDAFHRARNVGSIPGTGLGLAIVKRSVDLHGGEISVESEVGAGTTFTVTLPISV
jgi:signal transduction histidine kinase